MLCHRTGRDGQCTCFHHFPCSAKSFKSSGRSRRRGRTHSPLFSIGHHKCGFHTCYDYVWTTLDSFHSVKICCQGYVSHSKSYHLTTCRLACSTTKRQDFRLRFLGSPQLPEDPTQIECTTTGC